MMVSPDEIRASRAPSTRPLKHCDMKLAQLIIVRQFRTRNREAPPQAVKTAGGTTPRIGSGVVAEVAAESVGFLHQRRTRHDLDHFPVVLVVLHVLGRLALDDDDRADELVVLLAEVDLADR